MSARMWISLAAAVVASTSWGCDAQPDVISPLSPAQALIKDFDPSGQIATVSTNGAIDLGNAFFQSLGTNGRSCATCHIQGDAWSLSSASVRSVFAARGLSDPLFAAVDGANCPSATPAAGAAGYSLLLSHGLFRVGLTVPAGAEFTIATVYDPYGCALQGSPATASVYRRPLPTTNLRFLSAVMFDGRETLEPLTSRATFLANLRSNLAHQAMDATLGHAQAAASPTPSQLNAIVDFELALFTAQRLDNEAGVLNAQGGNGGPDALVNAAYFPGINDPLGGNPTGAAFTQNAATLYSAWQSLNSSNPATQGRKAVARGQVVFNTHPLTITNVAGLNDALGIAAIPATCTTCHNTPNVGNHSLPVPLDIGTSHAAAYEPDGQVAGALAQLRMPDMPIFKVTCTAGPMAGTVRYTSDPGRALITGRCADLGRVKGPILRGLAARAPFFHNGAAGTLDEVVAFYNVRFQMGLSRQEMSDLVAFLRSL